MRNLIGLRDRIQQRFPELKLEAWQTPVSVPQQKESYGDNLWEDNPNLCCHLRKVVPMKQNVSKFDLWTTAVRRTQTQQRKTIDVLESRAAIRLSLAAAMKN